MTTHTIGSQADLDALLARTDGAGAVEIVLVGDTRVAVRERRCVRLVSPGVIVEAAAAGASVEAAAAGASVEAAAAGASVEATAAGASAVACAAGARAEATAAGATAVACAGRARAVATAAGATAVATAAWATAEACAAWARAVAIAAWARAEATASGAIAEATAAWARAEATDAAARAEARAAGAIALARAAGARTMIWEEYLERERMITLADIVHAARWAVSHVDSPGTLHGQERMYRQSTWDCGTACCIWGAAHLARLGDPARDGPSFAWRAQSARHAKVADVLGDSHAEPDHVLAILAEDEA